MPKERGKEEERNWLEVKQIRCKILARVAYKVKLKNSSSSRGKNLSWW
jgi:hypothetical protein